MTVAHAVDVAFLERRRRLALRCSVGALLTAVVAWPVGMAINGSETAETISGMFLMAGIIGLVAAPWIVRAWQGFMRRRMVAAAVSHRTDIRHIDSEHDARGAQAALRSSAFDVGAFHNCGLSEAFESAAVQHVLTGDAEGVPFALAEVALLDAVGYRMFSGVLASFQLARPRPGLTVVTRDRGLVGNLLARAGGHVEPLTLEDPEFEGIFEVYGDDQVGGRVILTTTMLQRLKDLDELAHARGFACAFRGEHLLIAFDGMSWRCPAWRILRPLDAWLQHYADWLTGLVDLPRGIVQTLNLVPAAPGDNAVPLGRFVPEPTAAVPVGTGAPDVLSSSLWRIVGEGGMSAVYVMSGAMFGGVALIGLQYGLTEGYSDALFWPFWGMSVAGLVYGAFAIGHGVRGLARLAWKWKSPLRTMNRPPR